MAGHRRAGLDGSGDESGATELPNGFSRRQIAEAITPRVQELIILPTEKCNLRCTYCYEDFAIGKMSNTTQTAIERLVERRVAQIERLNFSWFGGEPLAAKDVVLRLSRYAKRVCEQNGVKFRGNITTNAYLMNKGLFLDLLECNQDFFQITLDGWTDAHDAVRRFADGRGSFSTIWDNLLSFKAIKLPFEVQLRIHVRRENIDNLSELMMQAAKSFGNDARFTLDFQHLRNLGGEGGASVKNPVNLRELLEIETRLRALYRKTAIAAWPECAGQVPKEATEATAMALLSAKASGESAGARRAEEIAAGGNYICYAAKPNSLLIRANGRIGKCTVAFSDERNDIGAIQADGTLLIDNPKLQPWIRGLEHLEIDELACPLKGMASYTSTTTRDLVGSV